jgi:chromosome transmission fidelity protein 18
MKQADSSLNTVLNNLFNPLSRKRVKELGMGEEDEGRYVARLSREVDGSGRESSIATGECDCALPCSSVQRIAITLGCFAHYITLRQHDANFSRYEKANEWLVTFDILSTDMYSNGDFALSQYLPYTLVPFYPIFQERGGQRVERSQADWEVVQS